MNDVFGIAMDLMDVHSQGFVRRNLLALLQRMGRTVYGGTMAKGMKRSIKQLTSVPALADYLERIREAVWPGGTFPTEWPDRHEDDEWDTSDALLLALIDSIPASLNSLLGKKHVLGGILHLHDMVNCAPVMRSLILSLLDSAFRFIVPPPPRMATVPSSRSKATTKGQATKEAMPTTAEAAASASRTKSVGSGLLNRLNIFGKAPDVAAAGQATGTGGNGGLRRRAVGKRAAATAAVAAASSSTPSKQGSRRTISASTPSVRPLTGLHK